ncbi:hypothetical protein CYMTET_10423 [Cymbomonas tetramitiformis]|uniref:Uncharacterized protein n=1 Tax=Cymbomonas tetramitiformis TaxID=36881 RepID=A0AAE0LEH3_9CHLO|nr:hypothetical protein CYMTET_10423 [Cymbomonas tetramitiformis]
MIRACRTAFRGRRARAALCGRRLARDHPLVAEGGEELSDRVNPKGFAPRADKRVMKDRFAAKPLPLGGNWSQIISKKVAAFHKGTGQTIPFCGNEKCMGSRLQR